MLFRSVPGSVGISLSAAKLVLMIFGDNTFAADASGNAAIVGLGDSLVLAGSLALRVNTSGRTDIEEELQDRKSVV